MEAKHSQKTFVVFFSHFDKTYEVNQTLFVPNETRCGYELLYLEAPLAYVVRRRGPRRAHLSNKLFLGGFNRENVHGSQKAELKIAWREAQKKKKKKVFICCILKHSVWVFFCAT